MQNKTIKTDENGSRHLAQFDAMQEWLAALDMRFATIKEGVNPRAVPGYDFEEEARAIFEAAPEDEQSMVFGLLLSALIEAKREPCFIEADLFEALNAPKQARKDDIRRNQTLESLDLG